ncbi:hypothetical protein [Streptomyces spectabilis]|uniref:Uncharacterized protein n=1 Tax=Streptomyces spectabilis TaxID=68270 RepID=A0A7W8B5K7_STRST|nr:hypothetical protein [Streptomyces spectabilis]MBB5109595.1 hypothetical protein [Streptomyces spectabilis]GGV54724.1 hypothetical protein GCM10010245_86570 [Streptomyces spectabilis]
MVVNAPEFQLPEDVRKDLDLRAQGEYDEGRVNYHSELIIVETPPSGRSCTRAGC